MAEKMRKKDMCHRLLKFVKHTGCDHNTFLGDTTVDCKSENCRISEVHPSTCRPCKCRRYYDQPERLITRLASGKCSNCPS